MKNLQKDGLFAFMETFNPTDVVIPIQNQPSSDVLQIVQKFPVQCQPYYRSYSQRKSLHQSSEFTFIEMMDVETFLHKLIPSSVLKEGIVKTLKMLTKLLTNPACELLLSSNLFLTWLKLIMGFVYKSRQENYQLLP